MRICGCMCLLKPCKLCPQCGIFSRQFTNDIKRPKDVFTLPLEFRVKQDGGLQRVPGFFDHVSGSGLCPDRAGLHDADRVTVDGPG